MGHAFALGGLGPGAVIAIMLLSLIFGALFLMLSFWIFERFTPHFGAALVAMFASFAALVLTDFILGLALRVIPHIGVPLVWAADLAIMFWIVKQMLRRPSGETLSYVRAGIITTGSFALEFSLLAILWLVKHYALAPH